MPVPVPLLPVLLLLPLLLLVTCVRLTSSTPNCISVQQTCASRRGCLMALNNYMLSCGPVVHGTADFCTPECHNALLTLLSMDDGQGEVFMTCDCGSNAMCERQKRRLSVCSDSVIGAMPAVRDADSTISCSLAQLICSADTSCYTALEYYYTYCRRMMRGERCTARCNNSLSILYSRSKAQKLRTCYCDGSEQYDCEQLRHRTQTLCFGHSGGDGGAVVVPTTHYSVATQRVRHHHNNHTRASSRTTTTTSSPPSLPSSTSCSSCDDTGTESGGGGRRSSASNISSNRSALLYVILLYALLLTCR